mgnify:CR=1 FL=1
MEALLSPASLARDVEALAAGTYLQDPLALLGDALALLTPPERISTVDCAETRKLPGATDGAVLQLRDDATYLVTGGLGSIGLEIAGYLAARGARNLVLTSRRAPGEAVQQRRAYVWSERL